MAKAGEKVRKERIEIEKLILDAGTQPRAGIDRNVVNEYADMMQEGDVFPEVEVFTDGTHYWLADGFHRVMAAKRLGFVDLDARLHNGGLREAQLYSAAANATHGLHRTIEDKRRAVKLLLSDPEWREWSDREIARMTKTSHTFVSEMRKEDPEAAKVTVRQTRRGTTWNTEASGKTPRDEPETEQAPEIEAVPQPVAASKPPPRLEFGDGSPVMQAAKLVVAYLAELSSREQVAPEQLEGALAWSLATLEEGIDREQRGPDSNGKAARPKRDKKAEKEPVAA